MTHIEDEVPKEDGSEKSLESNGIIPSTPFANLSREISEDDLQTQAVQRILLGEVDKLQRKNSELENDLRKERTENLRLRDEYHSKMTEVRVYEEKFKTSISHEVMYSLCLAGGTISATLAKALWSAGYGTFFMIIAVLFILGALISKAIRWK